MVQSRAIHLRLVQVVAIPANQLLSIDERLLERSLTGHADRYHTLSVDFKISMLLLNTYSSQHQLWSWISILTSDMESRLSKILETIV